MVEYRDCGALRIPILRLNRMRDERENYLATRAWFDAKLLPRGEPDGEITQAHRDVAAAPHQQRMRDVIEREIGDGTAQIMKLLVAREIIGKAVRPY